MIQKVIVCETKTIKESFLAPYIDYTAFIVNGESKDGYIIVDDEIHKNFCQYDYDHDSFIVIETK